MHIAVFGISHAEHPLSDREKWICWLRSFIASEKSSKGLSHVILITCNRCEIYFSGPHRNAFLNHLEKEFSKIIGKPSAYSYQDGFCFAHLAKVASGLLSAEIGESDIRRQIKQAYEKSCLSQILTSDLHYLFQKSLKIGKEYGNQIALKNTSLSLEKLVLNLCHSIPGPKKVFILGNSQMNRNLIHALIQNTLSSILFCSAHHATYNRFRNIETIDFSKLDLWKQCDIVISATEQNQLLLIEHGQPLSTKLCVDLSVPRSIDPSLAFRKELLFFNMENLNHILMNSSAVDSAHISLLEDKVTCAASMYHMRYHIKSKYSPASYVGR